MAPSLPGIAAANREALARLVAADPVLADCVPAAEALGLGQRVVLHAGPPIPWDRMCPPLRGAVVSAGTVRAPLGCFTAVLEGLARSRGVA